MPWVSKATDDFNRANETPLAGGTNWALARGHVNYNLVGSVAVPSDAATDDGNVYVGRSWTADQYSKAAVTDNGTNGAGIGNGVCVRFTRSSDSATEGYRIVAIAGAGAANIEVGRFKAGIGFTQLATYTVTYVAGATLEVRVTGQGTSTVIETIYNGVSVGTFADNGGNAINGPNYPGIMYSSASNGTTRQVDNWDGGELDAVALETTYRKRGLMSVS